MTSYELAIVEWPDGRGACAPLLVARTENPELLEYVLRRLRALRESESEPEERSRNGGGGPLADLDLDAPAPSAGARR